MLAKSGQFLGGNLSADQRWVGLEQWGKVRVLSWPGLKDLPILPRVRKACLITLAVLPGPRILCASPQMTLDLWDLQENRKLQTFLGHKSPTYTCATFASGTRLLTGSDDWTVRIWSTKTGRPLYIFPTRAGRAAHISPDGKTLTVAIGKTMIHGPLDRTLLRKSPQQVLREAQFNAGLKLQGVNLIPE